MPASAQYSVILDGQGYLVDPASYRRTIATPFSIKTRTGDPRYSDLVSGAAWAQSLWTDGVVDGSTEYDPRWPTRSGDSVAVDVSYPGDVRLGRTMTSVFSTELIGGLAVYRTKLYGIASTSGKVYETSDGVTWTLSIDLNTLSAVGSLGAIAVVHGYLFVGAADSGKLFYYDGTTWLYWDALVPALAIHALCAIQLPSNVGWPTSLIGVGYQESATACTVGTVVASPSGAITIASTYQFVNYPRVTVLVTGHDAVYVGAVDTSSAIPRGEVFQWNVPGSGVASSLRSLAKLPDNAITSLTRFREQAYAGTYTGGKVGRLSTADLVPFFRLPEVARLGSPPAYTKQVRTLEIDNDRMYAAFNDAAGLCLWQFDGNGWTRFATGGSGDPVAFAQFGGNLYVASANSTVYRVVLASYAASGTITTSWFDAELGGIPKAFSRVTLVYAPLLTGTAIAVAYALDDAAAFTTLGTANTVGSSTASFAFPAATAGLRIRLRFTLSSSNASYTPQLRTFVLEYQLQPALTATDPPTVRGEYRWDPLLEGTQELPLVRLDRSSEPKTGAQLRAALWASAAKAGPLTYVDTDGSTHSVWLAELEDHLLRDKEVVTRQGWRGSVKLVEA